MFPVAAYGKNSGFTLIEFVVSVVILSIGLLALLKTVNYAISQNDSNKMRNDAVFMADEVMSRERVKTFAQVTSATTTRTINYGLTVKSFTVAEKVIHMGSSSKNVQLNVSWQDRKATKNHYLSTVISDMPAN